MAKKNLVRWNPDNELITVNADEIPDIVAGTIKDISDLENEVRSSEESAKDALDYVHNSMKEYERGWLGWRKGNTKDIIEDTQEAVKRLADAQNVTVSAMQKALSFQKKLAEASKYLFGLGCANIATNRIAVRAIEMKLKGASGAKISELARQEMMAVVRQLKEQEDILKKQEFLTSKVQENVSRLDEKDQIDAEQTQRLDELSSLLTKKDEVDQKQEDAISANKKAIEKKY